MAFLCCFKSGVLPPQGAKSLFEYLSNYKHFIVVLLTQTIVAIFSFMTILYLQIYFAQEQWLMLGDMWAFVMWIFWCWWLVVMAGPGWGCHPGPSSNGYDWSLGPRSPDCPGLLTSHSEHHLTESNTSREQPLPHSWHSAAHDGHHQHHLTESSPSLTRDGQHSSPIQKQTLNYKLRAEPAIMMMMCPHQGLISNKCYSCQARARQTLLSHKNMPPVPSY